MRLCRHFTIVGTKCHAGGNCNDDCNVSAECYEPYFTSGPTAILAPETNRGREWSQFSLDVLEHVETYTVPQYGDAPHDQIETWSAQEVVRAIGKRAARFKRNSRPDQDLLDLKKIAHEACLAYNKLLREQPSEV